jgi:hypothetical protein
LGDLLKRFDAGYHARFNHAVISNDSHLAWGSIYNNRHAVAHGAGIQMNFADLQRAYADCLPVLDALTTVLGLTADETKDFV